MFPDFGVLDNRRIEPDDGDRFAIGADGWAFDHALPPPVSDVVFEGGAQWAVVPEAADAAVDFAGGVDEASAFAECDEFIHVFVFGLGHGIGLGA